jgi:hypothetical protein
MCLGNDATASVPLGKQRARKAASAVCSVRTTMFWSYWQTALISRRQAENRRALRSVSSRKGLTMASKLSPVRGYLSEHLVSDPGWKVWLSGRPSAELSPWATAGRSVTSTGLLQAHIAHTSMSTATYCPSRREQPIQCWALSMSAPQPPTPPLCALPHQPLHPGRVRAAPWPCCARMQEDQA